MIEVHDLVRHYGELAAVDGVSFAIEPGEVVGLLGHNGAGKTTIMKMLTGYLEPSAGRVLIDGVDVQAQRLQAQAQIGYLPESLPVYPEMTVMEYLSYSARLRDLTAAEVVPRAIAETGLQDKALDRIETLSRGYKQRVGVAQAILHQPRFLILDEPSNGLDPTQIGLMRDLIRRLAEQATVILSTHIMQEVSAVCDRAIIIRSGKVAIDERLADLRQSSTVRLRTTAAADVATALADCAGVTSVERQENGLWQLAVGGEIDQAVADIAACLVAADLPIHELSPAQRDLETIFRQVNEAADATGVADAA
ncbi:MAG: ABC transporter ATP-binding protein [Pseudomonadota bacterium]